MARETWETDRSRRRYWPGVLLRLVVLAIAVGGVLAIGQTRYGWHPLGDKITAKQLREATGEVQATPTPADMSTLLREAAQTADATPEPETTTSTPTTTTTTVKATTTTVKPTTTKPTTTTTIPKAPSDLTDQDQKALDDLLKQESD